VRDRLFPSDESDSKPLASFEPTKARLKTFLHGDGGTQLEGIPERDHKVSSRPIADLFPETTVMFADIVGFTAWSSTREPSQVFILLETLYGAFDAVAARRGVFKVETIGDSYVAVAGLPEARPDRKFVPR
jgi:class 3 adenylate cyclase